MADNKEKKTPSKIFQWFTGYGKDGKGVSKREYIKGYNLKNLFRLYFRRFSAIFSLNIIYILMNFPLFFLVIGLSGITSHVGSTPMHPLYSVMYGIMSAGGNTPSIMPLFGMYGIQSTIYASTTLTYIMYGIGVLDIFLIGPINMGMYYVMRELVRGEPLFVRQDFFGAMKANWKQGIIFGIFDSVMLALIAYSIYSYYINYANYYILFFFSIFMAVFYLMMRTYIYILAVTFDQNVFKILKNSFIFALLRFGKNLLALIFCVLLILLAFSLSQLFMPLGFVMALTFMFSTCIYIPVYAAYPKIKEVMLDPYYKEHPEEKPYGWDGVFGVDDRTEVNVDDIDTPSEV